MMVKLLLAFGSLPKKYVNKKSDWTLWEPAGRLIVANPRLAPISWDSHTLEWSEIKPEVLI